MITQAQIDAATKAMQRHIDLEIVKALRSDSFFATPQHRGNNYMTEYVSMPSTGFILQPPGLEFGCGCGNCPVIDQ
jgi:hypothetical protein